MKTNCCKSFFEHIVPFIPLGIRQIYMTDKQHGPPPYLHYLFLSCLKCLKPICRAEKHILKHQKHLRKKKRSSKMFEAHYQNIRMDKYFMCMNNWQPCMYEFCLYWTVLYRLSWAKIIIEWKWYFFVKLPAPLNRIK